MTYSHVGDKFYHTVNHTESCTQDGNDRDLLACKHLNGSFCNGSLDLDFLHGKISCYLISHEHGDLGYKLPELLSAGILITQKRHLMLNERMIKNEYVVLHVAPP